MFNEIKPAISLISSYIIGNIIGGIIMITIYDKKFNSNNLLSKWTKKSKIINEYNKFIYSDLKFSTYLNKKLDNYISETSKNSNTLMNHIGTHDGTFHVDDAIKNRFNIHKSGEIIILEQFCPWKAHLYQIEKENNIKYVIYHDGKTWRINGVNSN